MRHGVHLFEEKLHEFRNPWLYIEIIATVVHQKAVVSLNEFEIFHPNPNPIPFIRIRNKPEPDNLKFYGSIRIRTHTDCLYPNPNPNPIRNPISVKW